jgi:hypothetical protein
VNTIVRLALAMLLMLPAGCRRVGAPEERPGTDPLTTTASGAVEFASDAHGVRLAYPPGWEPAPSADYVLMLAPVGRAADDTTFATASMSLDVPKLPLHIPGLIPLGAVVNGYVDDLKGRYGDMNVAESAPATLAGAKARRVRSTWTAAGRPVTEDAVLAVHGDRVYILRLTADARDYGRARDAFEGVLRSVRWTD